MPPMRILVIPADSEPTEQFVADDLAHQLTELQAVVGGYLQTYIIPKRRDCVLLAREFDHPGEEAAAPVNGRAERLTGFALRGTVVVAGHQPPDLTAVPADAIKELASA